MKLVKHTSRVTDLLLRLDGCQKVINFSLTVDIGVKKVVGVKCSFCLHT